MARKKGTTTPRPSSVPATPTPSATSAAVSIPVPPADLANLIRTTTWPKARVIHRIHPDAFRGDQFNPGPDGMTGNDDLGTMSAWYVLSSWGLHPPMSGANYFVVSSPQFERTDITIVSRARDDKHAAQLYDMGVDDAVPETIEASLQLSEAVLADIGVPMGLVIASIHERRDEYRAMLRRKETDTRPVFRARRHTRAHAPSTLGTIFSVARAAGAYTQRHPRRTRLNGKAGRARRARRAAGRRGGAPRRSRRCRR